VTAAVRPLTITLPPHLMDRLRASLHVWWDDNTGCEVLLVPDGAQPDGVYDNALVVRLSRADVELICSDPAGLTAGAETPGTGWLLRAETVA
jgi:hypothetical protein